MKNSVYIIGGGPSLENFNFSKLEEKDVITINKSIYSYQNCKYFITMDHSFLMKQDKVSKHLKSFPATKIFIANLCPEYLIEKNGRFVDTRWNLIYKLNAFDMIIKSRNIENFGFDFNNFSNGNNSGYCAIQLAIILGYKEIHLLGFDLDTTDKTHYHGGYGESTDSFNKKLEQYYQYLKKAILNLQSTETDIKIYSHSDNSKLNSILTYKNLDDL